MFWWPQSQCGVRITSSGHCAHCHMDVTYESLLLLSSSTFGLDLSQIVLLANELNGGWQAALTTICIADGMYSLSTIVLPCRSDHQFCDGVCTRHDESCIIDAELMRNHCIRG